MDVRDAIYGRRAIRSYRAEPVAQNLLESLIEAAIQAPSAMHEQPWAFCVVRDPALLDRISREAKAQLLRTPPPGVTGERLQGMLADEHFDILYHAPVLVVIWATQDSSWSTIDCTLAAQNLMLRACDLGLGTCWIGLAQAWLESAEGRAALGISESWKPVAPIIVGRPAGDVTAPERRMPQIRWIG